MPETLAFSYMSWEILEERYDIQARFERILLTDGPPVQPSAALVKILAIEAPLATLGPT